MEFIYVPDQHKPMCANCKNYCESVWWLDEGKCARQMPEELIDVKSWHTCKHYEWGIPAKEQIVQNWDIPEELRDNGEA